MITVRVTIGDLMDRNVWSAACHITGMSPWIVNEGQADRENVVELSVEAARSLGLLRAPGGS